MNEGKFAGTVLDYRYSHSVNGVKIYQGQLSIARNSGVKDIVLFSSWRPDIEAGKFYEIQGEVRTLKRETYPKKEVYIKTHTVIELTEPVYWNEVELSGVMSAKRDLRKTPFGRIITDFTLCVQNGKSMTYMNSITWNYTAAKIDSLPIGSEIKVYGRLQSREYAKNEITYTVNELSCSKIEVISNVCST